MKRNLLIALISIGLPLLGLAQPQKPAAKPAQKPASKGQPLDLKVHVNGLTGGDVIFANYYGDKQYIQDTVKVDAMGNFEIKADTAVPGGIYILVLPNKKYMEVVLTDVQKFSMSTDTADLVKKMKVTGNTENQYFYEYLGYLNDKQKEVEPLQNALKGARDRNQKDSVDMLTKKTGAIDSVVKAYKRDYYKKTHPTTFMAKVLSAMDEPDPLPKGTMSDSAYNAANYWNFRNHYWDGMDFSDDRLIRSPVYANKLDFYLDKLTPQHPDSIAAACDWICEKTRPSKELFKYTVAHITYRYENPKIMGFDAIFVHMVDRYYKTNQVWWVGQEQMTKIINRSNQVAYTLLGKTAVNLSLQDTTGKIRQLQNVQAKYTLVIFWDPTCSHCKKEIPELKQYYDSLHKAGVSFEVYAIYSELDYKTWKAYIKEHHLEWVNVCGKDAQELALAKYYYDVYSTPTIYLLDENKKIFAKRLDVTALKGFFDKRIEEDRKKEKSANTPK
jgi:thiol-disulfide isomerase/thioredoxin